MEILLYNISQLVKITLPFAAVFLVIPLVINRSKEQSNSLKLIKGIILAVFTAVCTGYLLSYFKFYNIFFLTVFYFPMLIILFLWVEGIKPVAFCKWLSAKIKKHKVSVNNQQLIASSQQPKAKSQIFFIIMFLSMFIYFFFLRGYDVLTHIALYFSDPFVHLKLLKLFISGEIISTTSYPMGYHAIMGLISAYSFTDPMEVLRIFGPVQSTMIIFTIFFMVHEITKNKYAALLAASVLGLDVTGVFPNVFYRQMMAAPQEFAAIFFLPVIYFAVQYLREHKAKDLKYLFLGMCSALFVHPRVSVLILFPIFSVFITAALLRLWKLKTLTCIGIIGALTVVLGILPMVEWFNTQNAAISYDNMQTSVKMLEDWRQCTLTSNWNNIGIFFLDALNPIKDTGKWDNAVPADIIIYSAIISLFYIVIRILFKIPLLKQHIFLMVLFLTQIFYIIFYYGESYNLPQIMYFERMALVFSLTTFTVIGILINEIFICSSKWLGNNQKLKNIIYSGTTFAVLFLLINIIPKDNAFKQTLQYEGALKAYIRIKEKFEPKTWTIVSPVEEYPLALGYGWHYELCNFPKNFNMEEAQDCNFRLGTKIGTKHIFIYVEKDPLPIWATIPEEEYNAFRDDDPYRSYSNRMEIEEYVQNWMHEYINSHDGLPDNARVFYEDIDLIVYHIVSD